MAEVLLLHHICGLTSGVRELADAWRRAGHTVHTPDLFEGHTFDAIAEGSEFTERVGFDEIRARAARAAEDLTAELVYAGISMGVMAAQTLAVTRRGARGAVLMEAFIAPEWAGPWPEHVPAQIHGMDHDEFFAGEGDLDHARALAASREDVELFVYPGTSHLFEDRSLPSHDAQATALLNDRVLEFLARR
ncbi:MAG: dienelactone hydrolase [Nitriliruptor sp.]|nr:MAG: dienelactone hydrolase [Nitriliruptor sp.]